MNLSPERIVTPGPFSHDATTRRWLRNLPYSGLAEWAPMVSEWVASADDLLVEGETVEIPGCEITYRPTSPRRVVLHALVTSVPQADFTAPRQQRVGFQSSSPLSLGGQEALSPPIEAGSPQQIAVTAIADLSPDVPYRFCLETAAVGSGDQKFRVDAGRAGFYLHAAQLLI